MYTYADTQFAHEYAAEMLIILQETAAQGDSLYQISTTQACDYFIDSQERFNSLKHAALFLKADMALDFVYAFSLAQDWCNYASHAADNPHDKKSARLAQEKYQQAYQEFKKISMKEYKPAPAASQSP